MNKNRFRNISFFSSVSILLVMLCFSLLFASVTCALADVAGEIVVSSDANGLSVVTALVTAFSLLANFVPRKTTNPWLGWVFKMIHLGAANIRIK